MADPVSDAAGSAQGGEEERLESRLRDVLEVLRPYLVDLVLVGGWVPALHRRYGGLAGWTSKLSFTSEADVTVAGGSLARGDRAPLAELLTRSGLRPVGDATGAAVWTHADGGEALEFLTSHHGPFRASTMAVAVGGQPGITAIMLPDIELLGRHTAVLQLPAAIADGGRSTRATGGRRAVLAVRVPTLGAYMINKALTFPRRVPRTGHAFNPKRGKDVLYLRDLMAGGGAVAGVIAHDVQTICNSASAAQFVVDAAVSHLELALAGRFSDYVVRAAAMLTEREPRYSLSGAQADIRGHLTDALELVIHFRSPNPLTAGPEE